MSIKELLDKIIFQPETLLFNDVIGRIDDRYDYSPVAFSNGLGEGALVNAAGVNEGSCKVFAFALLNELSEQQTLNCFAEHYRDVLADPHGSSHANIRRFMQDGWPGVRFESPPLKPKKSAASGV